jgi:Na+/proline symporter
MAATAAAFAVLVSLALYILISLWGRKGQLSVSGFFHDAGKPWMAIVSLTACNVTLGTGIAYILTQANSTGWLVLLTPLGITVGYFAIAEYYKRLAFQVTIARPNLYYLLATTNEDGSVRPSFFQKFFTWFIAVTYFLLIAFELSVGSAFLGSTLLAKPSPEINVGIATLVFGVVIAYTSISGVRAAVQTDVVQIVFIVLFIAIIPFLLLEYGKYEPGSIKHAPISLNTSLTSLLAILTAIATQFYNIVNPQIVMNHRPADQVSILRWAGVYSGLMYVAIACIGLMTPSKEGLESAIRAFLYSPESSGYLGILMAMALFTGMLAVLLSTLDNLAISIAQLVYDMLPSRRNELIPSDGDSTQRLRVVYVITGILVIPLSVYFYYSFTSTFFLLLTILFAVMTLSPPLFVSIFLKSRGRTSILDNKAASIALLAFTALAWLFYAFLNRQQQFESGTVLHLCVFFFALLIAAADAFVSKPSQPVNALTRG